MTPRTRNFLTGSLMPLSALAAAFLLSVILFFVFRPDADGRVFFYPDNTGTEIGSERRGIPGRRNLESKVTVFLEELFVGPVDLGLSKTAPRSASVKHVAVIGKVAYVDLEGGMLKTDKELAVSFDEALENIRYNILFNFPRIEDVVFTIEGRQVHAPFFAGEAPAN